MKYTGGCHCGAVRFEVEVPEAIEALDCNCSICAKSGFWHLIVPLTRFTLLQGKEQLQTYRFGTGVAQHMFCKVCGVKPFYVPRSNPDGMDINVRCLDERPPNLTIKLFDGQNWEQNAGTLAHLSEGPTTEGDEV